MPNPKQLERREVVTAFLRHGGKVLLVRRSDRVGSYRGRWAGISGYLEEPDALAQALREIREETGLTEDHVRLAATGRTLEVPAPELGVLWVVHPFLFDIEDPGAIRLDWEHLELNWAAPEEVGSYATVPSLAEALASCRGAEERGAHG